MIHLARWLCLLAALPSAAAPEDDVRAVVRTFFDAAGRGDREATAPLLHERFRFILPDEIRDRSAFLDGMKPQRVPAADIEVRCHGPVAVAAHALGQHNGFQTGFWSILVHQTEWRILATAQISRYVGGGTLSDDDAARLRGTEEQLRALATRCFDHRAEGEVDRVLRLSASEAAWVVPDGDGLLVAPAIDPALRDALLGTIVEPVDEPERFDHHGFFTGCAWRTVERIVDGEATPAWQFVLLGLDRDAGDYRLQLYCEAPLTP